tara:strand:- start:247 stop:858 length:612 start_codon:yes stop_codon:yes gene_type:complete
MTCLYKEVAKERGYNKLNRMHYQLLEWNCNKWTKTVIDFYAEPIDAGKDSKADKWFKSLLDKEELFLSHSVTWEVNHTYPDSHNGTSFGDRKLSSIRSEISIAFDRKLHSINFYAHGEDRHCEAGYQDIIHADLNTVDLERIRYPGIQHPVIIHYHDFSLKTVGSVRQSSPESDLNFTKNLQFLAISSYDSIKDYTQPFKSLD